MEVGIFSDDQAAAERLRSVMAECDISCPIDRVWPTAAAESLTSPADSPLDALFVLLEENEQSLECLEKLCARRLGFTVAVGTARDPKFMMRVIHAGPGDYLDIEGDLAAEMRRALGRLRESSEPSRPRGRVYSVFSHCGGSGCSLLAVNLAVALAAESFGCLLCDFNVRRGDLAPLLNLKPQFCVNDLCKTPQLKRDLFEQALTPHSSGVRLLAAPATLSDVRPIPVATVSQILSHAREVFPFTVADLEDFFHPEQSAVLRQSDCVLFVMRLDYTALRNARRTFEYLEREGIDGSRFRFVVNQYGRSKELSPSQAEEVLGRPLDYYLPFDQKVAVTSVNRGIPFIESVPRSRIARAVRSLATELLAPAASSPAPSSHGA
jgi:pilus assembly protein CpaE